MKIARMGVWVTTEMSRCCCSGRNKSLWSRSCHLFVWHPVRWSLMPSPVPLIFTCNKKKEKTNCLKPISHLKLCNSKWAPLKQQELVCLGEYNRTMTVRSPQILLLLELLCVFSECTVPCGTISIPTASLSAETSHLNSVWVVFSWGCDASAEREPDSGTEKVTRYAGKHWWCIKKYLH